MRRDTVGDLAAVALCAGGGVLALLTEVLPGGLDPGETLGVVVGAGLIAAIPLRRRAPVLFTVVAALLGTVAPVAAYVELVGLFTAAVLRGRPVVVALAVLSVAASLLELWFSVPDPVEFRWAAGFVVGLVLACAASGMYVGARRELLTSLRERAERAEVEQARLAERARTTERRRIAREMHDVLGHRLSLLSVHAGALELRGDLGPETVAHTAGVLRETARAALEDLREVLLVLREPPTDDPDRPQPRLADLPRLVADSRATGMAVDLVQDVGDVPPDQLGRTAYRVVQEGLTNAHRHAAGAPVRVEVKGASGAALSIRVLSGPGRRDGTGSGTGLIGLGERVGLLGGALDHGVGADGRHVLTATLPWPP